MKPLPLSIATLAVAGAFWLLAIIHPVNVLLGADAQAANDADAASLYVAALSQAHSPSQSLREALEQYPVIGYASEAAIDTRVGGPEQARYYLAQFALAPTLLELEAEATRTTQRKEHDIVLANFLRPEQLVTYLRLQEREVVVSVNDRIALTRRTRR
jgi:hypothetical protein